MKRTAFTASFGLLALTALLADCGNSSTPALTPSNGESPAQVATTAPGTELISVSLDAGLTPVGPASLTAQGIPFLPDGTPAVQTVRVRVLDAAGTPVMFDDSNAQLSTGTHAFVELHPGGGRVTVRLAPGKYSFREAGLATPVRGGAPLLAFGVLADQAVTGSAPISLNLPLRTLIGGHDGVSLTSLLPVTSVVLGQKLDLMLNVQTPQSGTTGYQVPISDFDVSYTVDGGQGQVVTPSKLGTRVFVNTQVTATALNVTATVSGLKETGAETAETSTFTATFSRPIYSSASLGVDLQRPKLSICVAKGIPSGSTVTGVVNDNVGVARVQMYAGPLLLASTDAADRTDSAVKEISLQPITATSSTCPAAVVGDSQFSIDSKLLQTDVQTQTLTVLAVDTSGNQTVLTLTPDVLQQLILKEAAVRAHALALQGETASQVAGVLQSEYALTDAQSAKLLKNEAFTSSQVGAALKAVCGSSAVSTVGLLRTVGYSTRLYS